MKVILGVVAVGYGAYTAWALSARPEQFGKIEPMKKLRGARAGAVVHVLGFTVLPIVLGIVLILAGLDDE